MINAFFFINDFFRQIKTSSKIIMIVFSQLLITTINISIIHNSLNTIEKDASIINKSGIIRGGIQRVVKLEINGVNTDNEIKEIDTYIRYFFSIKVKNSYFLENFEVLNNQWNNLKSTIMSYRTNPSNILKNELVEQSEITWLVAYECVNLMQDISEYKLTSFNRIYIIFFIDFMLIGFTIWFLYFSIKMGLENDARIDSLTKVFNRNVFNDELENEINRNKRYGSSLSLILIDIDHFKKINDSFGHSVGDLVLFKFASTIKSLIRKNDIFCRIGGEEFIIITTNIDKVNTIKMVEKIKENVSKTKFEKVENLTCSMGVSFIKDDDTVSSFYKRVDDALYKSKKSGRDTITIL